MYSLFMICEGQCKKSWIYIKELDTASALKIYSCEEDK